MKHLILPQRKLIEFHLSIGENLPKIAQIVGKHPSTIRREILNRRMTSDKNYQCSNHVCVHFEECRRLKIAAIGESLRKRTPRCFDLCPDFREAVCPRIFNPPFVCNGCEKEHNCPLQKKFYIASVAQTNYEALLQVSRTGVRPSEEEIKAMDDILTPSILKGQSITAILAANKETFKTYSKSIVYEWIQAGLFTVKGHNLPYAGMYKKPHKKAETKTSARHRIGRTYIELKQWLAQNPHIIPCEMDTVEGTKNGKLIFTFAFPKSGFALGFLREAKSAQTCTRIFNMLWELAGPNLFRKLFAAILGDNGPEFSDPWMIENYRPDPIHNPTKLVPRGVKVWYADSYSPTQKPHVERFHRELRRILPKGTSFNPFEQSHISLAISHVNSYPSELLNGKTPYEAFVEEFGPAAQTLLTKLGIQKIPPREVTLHPFLLGQKYQRAADRAILKKHNHDIKPMN